MSQVKIGAIVQNIFITTRFSMYLLSCTACAPPSQGVETILGMESWGSQE
jgi:hypothetical protein